MNILVVSDSHGLTDELSDIVERHEEDVDVMIHCGDSELPPDHPALSHFHNVQGNMDLGHTEFPNEQLVVENGVRIFVTHGHLYNVKMSYMKLSYKAEENDADLICFGHSHSAESFEKNGMIFVNPGSIRLPRGRFEKSYAICDFSDRTKPIVRYYDLEGTEINDLTKSFER